CYNTDLRPRIAKTSPSQPLSRRGLNMRHRIWSKLPMSFLDRERTIAEPGYSRWLVPPAALAIHMCIGQAYAFSVFNLPLTKLIGITKSAPDDWKLTSMSYIFSV